MKTNTYSHFCFNIYFSQYQLFSVSQNSNENYELLLKIGNVNVQENLDDYITKQGQLTQKSFGQHYYNIVQFHQLPTNEEKVGYGKSGNDIP